MYIHDRLIAGLIAYRKTRVWDLLAEYQLLGLVRRDGGTDYIWVEEDKGIEIYKEEELYSFNIVKNILENQDDYWDPYPEERFTAEEKTQLHMISGLHIEFGPKKYMTPLWVQAIDRYKKKKKLRLYGRRTYFLISKNIPKHIPRDVISSEDERRVLDVLRLLDWLSRNREWVKPYREVEQAKGDRRQRVVLYKPLENGAYETSVIYAPNSRRFPFDDVPFEYEVLARQIKPLASQNRDVMECNLFMPDKPLVEAGYEMPEEGGDLEEAKTHLVWPWLFIAGLAKEQQIFYMKGFQDADMEELRKLAQQMIQKQYAPHGIWAANEWTYSFMADFCEKAGIELSLGHNLWVEDAAEDFLDHMKNVEEEDEEDEDDEEENDEAFRKTVAMLRLLPDEEMKKLPQFIRDALLDAYADLPEDLRQRCVKLWKWDVK